MVFEAAPRMISIYLVCFFQNELARLKMIRQNSPEPLAAELGLPSLLKLSYYVRMTQIPQKTKFKVSLHSAAAE